MSRAAGILCGQEVPIRTKDKDSQKETGSNTQKLVPSQHLPPLEATVTLLRTGDSGNQSHCRGFLHTVVSRASWNTSGGSE